MKTIELKSDKFNFKEVIASTLQNKEEILIKTGNGSVVLVNKKDWDGIQETLLLLKDKKALSSLLKGHEMRDSGIVPGKNVNEVFIGV